MKGRIILILLLAIAVCSYAYAGGSGNFIEPIKTTTKHIGIGAGFEYNYVGSRANSLTNYDNLRSMKIDKISQIYGKFAYGITEDLNIYAKIGSSNYDMKFWDKVDNVETKLKFKDGLYTGFGVNGLYYFFTEKLKNMGVGFDIQGNWFYNDVKSVERAGASMGSVDGCFYGFDGRNSLYLTYKMDVDMIKSRFIPYIGAYENWMMTGGNTLKYKNATGSIDVIRTYGVAMDFASFGMVLGMDIDVMKYAVVNIEGRIIGENAVTVGVSAKF